MNRLRSSMGRAMATIIPVILVLLLGVDVGFWLYDPSRVASALSSCTLSIFQGTAEVQTQDTVSWKEARNGMSLEPGSRVRTGRDSQALLTFADSTMTRLEASTDLAIDRLEDSREDRFGVVVLKQWSGKTWHQVLADPRRYFEVRTPSTAAVANGTLFLTEVAQSGHTFIQTTEGLVYVSAAGQEVQVASGQQTQVGRGASPQAPWAVSPARHELVLTVGPPASGLVVEPSGLCAGYRVDGSRVSQISGSKASITGESGQVIRVSELMSGTYRIVLRGTDNATSDFAIQATVGGDGVFRYASSWKATPGSELALNLQVNVVDGLLRGVSLGQPEPPRGQVAAAPAKSPAGGKEDALGFGGAWTDPRKVYQYSELLVIAGLIVFIGIVLALVYRRH